MNYLKKYYKIVNRAFLEKRVKHGGIYYEAHHVKPSCLGGSRLVLLTAREHYLAHFLLYKHYKKFGNTRSKIKMARAWFMMTWNSNVHERYNSKTYELARIAFVQSITGENHPLFGKHHSDETKRKIRKKHIGKILTNEHKEKIGNAVKGDKNGMFGVSRGGEKHPMFGKQHSDKTKKQMSESKLGENNPMFGKGCTEERRNNISSALKGKPKEIFICPHCGKEVGGKSNLERWHNDNCKLKEIL